jgi:tRNA(Ile)-lysidine synthase
LIRPLLEVSKQALCRYAAEHKIKFREDTSNASTDILRNRVRRELVPLLKKNYQPALQQVLPRTIELVRAESSFVELAARDALERMHRTEPEARDGTSRTSRVTAPKDSRDFDDLHVAVQRRVLQMQLIELGFVPDFELIETLRQLAGKPVCTIFAGEAAGLSIFRDPVGLVHIQSPPGQCFPRASLTVDMTSRTGMASFEGLKLRWKIEPKAGAELPKPQSGQELFDADCVGQQVELRHWLPGDRFQPIGMNSAIKIQDFFTNQKVPRHKRHELLLAATAGGEVFWIEGMRIADRFKLTPHSIRRLHWAWERF